MTCEVAAIATIADEPDSRIERLIEGVQCQTDVTITELVLAVPPRDAERTRSIAAQSSVSVVVVENRTGERSAGLNLAVDHVHAPVVVRVDARSVIPSNYFARLSARLEADERIGVAGAHQVPFCPGGGIIAQGIARALGNRLALGGVRYRGGGYGPVDTVYLGAWRSEEVRGWRFDERLLANEDFELCGRIAGMGRLVWLEEGLHVPYESRDTLVGVFRQYETFGRSKVRYWRLSGARPNARQRTAFALAVGAVAAVPIARRRPERVLGGLALVLMAVDSAGSSSGPAQPAVRLAASLAIGVVWSAWLLGVVRETLLGRLTRGAAT